MPRVSTNHLNEVSRAILDDLSLGARIQAIRFISPNEEPLTDDGVELFYNLLREHTIEFADEFTPNVHLHAPAFIQYCPTCNAKEG